MACCALNASSVASSSTAEGMNGLEPASDGRRVGRAPVIAATGWQMSAKELDQQWILGTATGPQQLYSDYVTAAEH